MSDLPTLNKKIKEVIFRKADGNSSRFAEIIGISQQKLNRLFNIDRRTNKYPNPLRTDIVDRILSTFNDVNKDWLLGDSTEPISMGGKLLNGNFEEIEDDKSKVDSVTPLSNESHMEVEYRDLSVSAGPLSRVDSTVPKKTLLVPKEYDRGEYLVVRVDGPSMDDGSIYSIPNGANILIKRFYLGKGEKLPIRDNLFVIDAKDGQALKQITEHNVDLGYITCHSYNKEFRDYNIPMEDVLAFYIFRKIVGFRPPVRDIN